MAHALVESGDYVLKTRSLQASNGQSLTLSGLAGDTDMRYIVHGRLLLPSATANTVTVRPNGLNTNIYSRDCANYASTGQNNDGRIAAIGSAWTGSPLVMDIELRIRAATTQDGNACFVSWESFATLISSYSTFETYSFQTHAYWNQTASELTSLQIYSSNAGGILSGSELLCYAPTATFTP